MTSCEIKAKKTIIEDIKEKASADSSWNANFKDKDNSITVFFPSIEGDQVTALENAKQFKVSVEDTYSPFIYKQIAVINTDLVDGVEVNYTITDKLLKDQEIRNNIDELSEEDYYKMLAEIEEKQQELVHQIIYENPEDYLSEDKGTGFEIYAVVNGVVQRDISKLTRIQDLDEINKRNYQLGEKNYRYSADLSVSDQEKIVEQLTGMLMDNIANDLLNGKSPQIFYTKTVKIGEQEKQLRLLTVKKAIDSRVVFLYNKKKNNPESFTPEEDKEFVYLSLTWNDKVFLRMQEDVVNRLRARGYKFKKGKPVEMTKDDGNLKDLYEEFASQYDVEFEEAEDITGKADQFSDYSAITTSNKEKMSSRLRTFLSSIKNDKPSLIKLSIGNKSYRTQYVNENIVIQAINEVTVGLNTTQQVLDALDKASKFIKGREFLAEVREKLQAEVAKGTEIPNQFVDKFNQQKNTLTIAMYEKKPIVTHYYINKNGERVNVNLRNEKGEIQYYYDYKVINANRNDIATNLKEEIKQRFIEKYGLTEEVIPDDLLIEPYTQYLNFREYVNKNYEDDNFANPKEAAQKLKDLLSTLGFELSDDLYEELIENKRGRFNANFKLNEKATNSVFNKKYGILSLIFQNLNKKEVEKNLDLLFGNSGALKLFSVEASLTEYRYNTSTLDGKGRNIWGYSMPSPMFRELHDLLENDHTFPDGTKIPLYDILANEDYSLYSSSSRILKNLVSLSTEEKKLFKENIKYSLFNTLKQRSKEGKELTQMERAEFIASQIILHIGSDIRTGKDTYWSNKFLTTPSDKSLMYLIQTPNVNISVQAGKPVIGNNNEVEILYNYFLGEYRRAKAYQDGSEDYRNKVDNLSNYEPLIFFNFPQLNLKNDDNILWERKEDTWVLRNLDEVVGTMSVEDYVKLQLKKQLEKLVLEVREDLEETGLIQNGVFVNGIPYTYKKRAPESVSLNNDVKLLKKAFDEQVFDSKQFAEEYRQLNDKINKNMTDYMVQDYAINYLFHNIEMHLLLLGDPAQFLKDEKSKFINNPNIFNSNNISEIAEYIDAIEDNLSKRMAGAQANRMEGNTENENSRIVTVTDISTSSKIIDEINNFNKDKSETYKKIKSMDGQELMTGEEDLKQKLIHGKINQEEYNTLYEKLQRQHEDIEKNGFVLKENEFTKEDGLFGQPIKPVVYGNIYDPELKIFKTTYYKDSAFALYPQFTQGLELDKIRASLYNLSKNGTRVDRLVMKSAAKLGAKKPVVGVFNPDFTINQEVLEQIGEENIDIVPRSKQGIQLEVPYDEFKENIRIASQQIKLIFNEIRNVNWDNNPQLIQRFLPELKGQKVTGELLKNYHNRLYKEIIENSLTSILDEIGINIDVQNGTYKFENLEKLKNALQKTAAELGWSKISLEGLTITDDKQEFVIPVSFSKNSKRLEKLLLSLLNKAIIQKISGRSFILATEMGFVLDKSWIQELKKSRPEDKEITENVIEGEAAKEIIKQYKSSIVFTQTRDKDGKLTQVFDIDKGLLPARRKDPSDPNSEILPAQVLVSWKFNHNGKRIDLNDYIQEQEDGRKFLDTSKIDPEILRILGVRIPVQGHPSMASIEIVGFLPEFMGDIIIAPQDFVAMMGSDFDIDKLYGYMYNYFYDKRSKKISKLKFDESKIKEIDEEDLFFDLEESFTDFIDILEEKKKAREKYIKTQKKKMLQNKMIDIYHTIMLHPAVYDKSLKGITEGRLGELSSKIKNKISKKDYDYYSPFSPIKKTNEYFENKAGKLGVGVFSVNSTFLTIIEGLGLYLKKPIIPDENTTEEDTYDYFTIPFNEDTKDNPAKFYQLSIETGVNNLISMFQSASVDNAKLKYLNWINVNKDTMGVAAVLCGLANDKILGKDGNPLLNEDYIVYFLSQPIIRQYIKIINSQNVFTEYTDVNLLVDSLLKNYENAITEKLKGLSVEAVSFYKSSLSKSPSYTLEELQNFLDSSDELSKPTNENNLEYLLAQYQIINKFLSLKQQADTLRQVQYLVNADSKGLPGTLAESNYKRERTNEMLSKGSPYIGNINRVFLETTPNKEVSTNKQLDESKEVNPKDKSLFTLQGYLNFIANDVAVKIFSIDNKIIASGSLHIERLSSTISLFTGRRQETYPYELVNKITEAYIAYRQSTDELEIQSPDNTVKQEIIDLLQDSDTNTSLATDIENFKKSQAYKSLDLVKPFIESLRIKNFDGFRFVDYNPSQGLLNTDEQIVQALTELADLDGKLGTYPLFEKLMKYTFLVKIQNSPVTFKQFIPPYYQEAIGLAKKLREINESFNKEKNDPYSFGEIDLPVIGYEANGILPVYNFVEQFFQHFPEELKSVKTQDFTFIDKEFKSTSDRSDVIMINGIARSNYSVIKEGMEIELPYVSIYNYNEGRPNIYKKMPGSPGYYYRIPNLGRYNLDEFNKKSLSTIISILPSNKVQEFEIIQPGEIDVPTSPSDFIDHSGGARGADEVFDREGKKRGVVDFRHYYTGEISEENAPLGNIDITNEPISKEGAKKVAQAANKMWGYDKPSMSDSRLIRNWAQVANSEAIFAVAPIGKQGDVWSEDVKKPKDKQRVIIKSEAVQGGTGYAVEMAIQAGKPVYVYNDTNKKAGSHLPKGWYTWDGTSFVPINTPILTKNFAGIGSRNISAEAEQAIANLYDNTFANLSKVTPTQPSISVKPTVKDLSKWADLKDATNPYTNEGIVVTRISNTEEHFGNPFIGSQRRDKNGNLVKSKVDNITVFNTIDEADQAYRDWLMGVKHQNVQPSRREWILKQINEGKLDGKTLLYYKPMEVTNNDGSIIKGGYHSHADTLAEIVEELRTKPTTPTVTTKILKNEDGLIIAENVIPKADTVKMVDQAKKLIEETSFKQTAGAVSWGYGMQWMRINAMTAKQREGLVIGKQLNGIEITQKMKDDFIKTGNSKGFPLYGYTTIDKNGNKLPPIPQDIINYLSSIGIDISQYDASYNSVYDKTDNGSLIIHQDNTETNKSPIITISLGRPMKFVTYELKDSNDFNVADSNNTAFRIAVNAVQGEALKLNLVPESAKDGKGNVKYGHFTPDTILKYAKEIDKKQGTNLKQFVIDKLKEQFKNAEKTEYTLNNGAVLVFSGNNRNVLHEIVFDPETNAKPMESGFPTLKVNKAFKGLGQKDNFVNTSEYRMVLTLRKVQGETLTNVVNQSKFTQTLSSQTPTVTTEVKVVSEYYSGLTSDQKSKLGPVEDIIKTFKQIPKGISVESFLNLLNQKLVTSSPSERSVTLATNNLSGIANSAMKEYGIVDSQTDQEKVTTVINKIINDSQSDQFRELAKLLKELDAKFNFTKDLKINFVQNQDSFYNPNDNSINLNVSQTDSQGKPIPPFSQRFQYEILHELVHSVLDNRLGLDQAGTIVRNRIARLTATLQSPENLQKAIDYFQLKDDEGNVATVDYLLDKLAKLRAATQDVNAVKYNSESERSVLNPLINEREFIASVLGDNETREWMNQVDYDETGSVLSKILDAFITFFNNLIRTFGFDVRDKSALYEGLSIVFDLVNYDSNNAVETVEFKEFGSYYRFEIDKEGNVVKGEYSQGSKGKYKELKQPSKKYLKLLNSNVAEKLTEEVQPTANKNVKTQSTSPGKTLQGEQVEAFEKAVKWLYKPANTERDENGLLTENAILDNMFFLSGPGGSGKTFITEIIVSDLIKKGKSAKVISGSAPTHQAKNVLRENLPKDVFATTLQALLGIKPIKSKDAEKSKFIAPTLETIEQMYEDNEALPIFKYDYLFIDEASMIDGSAPLVKKVYNVWDEKNRRFVDETFYDDVDLGTYIKEVLKLKESLTGKATKVFLMGDIVQVVPVGSGRFQISKLLTDLLKRQDNHALLDEIRRTSNEEIKNLSLNFRKVFYKLFNDNFANVKFIDILNSVNPNNGITLFNEKKNVIDTFIRLYNENIASGNPIPNYTNIIWYNNTRNYRTVNQTNAIRKRLFNNDEEINVNESLILKNSYTVSNFFGENEDLILGAETKLIVTSVKDDFDSVTVKRGKEKKTITFPVKNIIANVQVGNITLKNVPITIIAPSYFQSINNKYNDEQIIVEGKLLTKGELHDFIEKLNPVDYGYIVNSHKIQGSKVINPIVDFENMLNSPEDLLHINNMIYTAISRAVNSLYIFHPQLTPKEGKPISKLTGINNPQQTTQPEESKVTQEISVDYLNQRLQSLYKTDTNIRTNKSLSEEEKKKKLFEIGTKISIAKQNLKAIQEDFKLSEYFRIAQKEVSDLANILRKEETLTVEDLFQAIQTLNYFEKLYNLLKIEVLNYQDPNSKSEKVYVSPELWQKIQRYQSVASTSKDALITKSLEFFVAVYNQKTGKSIPIKDFIESEASSYLRATFLAVTESKQQSVRAIGQLVSDMIRQINVSEIEHESEDTAIFRKFEQKFDFKDLIRLIEYKDPYGVKRKESTFITRNSISYYLRRSDIFKQAETIYDKKEKSDFIKNELKKISYTVDARYLFVDEYLEEMRDYYDDPNIKWLDSNSQAVYEQKILDFHKEQLSEYGEEYAIYRNNDVLSQAKRKIEYYLEKKEEFLASLEEQKLSQEEKRVRFKDWISYNSPFVLLNETFRFSKEDGATLNREEQDTAKEQTPAPVMTSAGTTVMAKPYIDYKKRESKNYITNKARYKDTDGKITDFYDTKYSEMEQEKLAKESRINKLEEAGDTVGADKERKNLILWDYLQFAQERQKYYLDMLPYHVKKELKWFNLVDVPKGYGEQFSDKIDSVMSFSNNSIPEFIKSDLLGLAGLAVSYFWDPVVKKVSESYIENRKNYIDFVTNSVKLSYDPSGFNNTLNKVGAGGLRTTDVFNYFSYLRKAAIQYREKSQTEELIKIGQAFVTKLDTIDKSSDSQVKLTETELTGLNWHINTRLYGANKQETYQGTSQNLKKRIGSKGFQLTKYERDKLAILEQRIEILKKIIPTVKNKKMLTQLKNELNLAISQKESIKRQINKYTLFGTYSSYVSLKRLSFGVFGRFLDFLSTYTASFRQALDGRIYGTKSFGKSTNTIFSIYGLNALSSLTTAQGILSLDPAIAGIGVGARFVIGAAQQAVNKKEAAKINQILYRLGALDYMNYKEDDNVSSFVTKTNLTDEAIAAIKNLSPFSSLSQGEIINKGIPALAVMYETKLKDVNGNERSLIEAFDVDDNLNLIWKEDEFGSQEDAGFSWYKGQKMQKVISLAKSAQNITGGDYDTSTGKLYDASLITKSLMLLRRFMPKFISFRFGDTWTDESTGITYVPTYTAIARTLVSSAKKEESEDEKIARKIASKQFVVDALMIAILGLGAVYVIKAAIASMGDDDDEKKDLNWFYQLLELLDHLTFFDEVANYALTAIESHIKNELQFANPDVLRGRFSSGTVTPLLSDIVDFGYFIGAIYDKYSEKGDVMSHREMIGAGLAQRRKALGYYEDIILKNGLPVFDENGNPKLVMKPIYEPEINLTTGEENLGKYSKNYEQQSRVAYRFKRLLPFMILHSNYQKSLKKKIEREEKIKEEKRNK